MSMYFNAKTNVIGILGQNVTSNVIGFLGQRKYIDIHIHVHVPRLYILYPLLMYIRKYTFRMTGFKRAKPQDDRWKSCSNLSDCHNSAQEVVFPSWEGTV